MIPCTTPLHFRRLLLHKALENTSYLLYYKRDDHSRCDTDSLIAMEPCSRYTTLYIGTSLSPLRVLVSRFVLVGFDVEAVNPCKLVDVSSEDSWIRPTDRSPRDQDIASSDTLATIEQVVLDRYRTSSGSLRDWEDDEFGDALVKLRTVLCTLPAKADTDLENGKC